MTTASFGHRPAAAPLSWLQQSARPYRACDLCRSGTNAADGQRCCSNANVASRGRPISVDRARAHGGACGPEALYLSFPGLQP